MCVMVLQNILDSKTKQSNMQTHLGFKQLVYTILYKPNLDRKFIRLEPIVNNFLFFLDVFVNCDIMLILSFTILFSPFKVL